MPTKLAVLLFLLASTSTIKASPVQLMHQGLRLNGELYAENKDSDTIFLLVHGTWGHGKMEIISGMQSRLGELGENSLGLTLSLGLDNRHGFLGCSESIVARHDAAIEEIRQWIELLNDKWTNIIIVGHSRGGNQVALYNQTDVDPFVKKLVLIAPMTWSKTQAELQYKSRFGHDLPALIAQARTYPLDSFFQAGLINCDDNEVSAGSFLSYYSANPNKNTSQLLENIERPTLLFLGSEDELSKKYIDQKQGYLTSELVSEITIDGAGHFFLDLYLDELVESMLEWVKE